MMAQVLWGTQVHLSVIEQHREFIFHLYDCKKSWRMAWLELDKNINIAVRLEVFTQYGAEKSQTLNMMTLAESHKVIMGDIYALYKLLFSCTHCCTPLYNLPDLRHPDYSRKKARQDTGKHLFYVL